MQLKSFERSSSCKSELRLSQVLLHRCHYLYQHHQHHRRHHQHYHHHHHHHHQVPGPSFLLLPPEPVSSSASTSNLSDLSNSSRAPRLGPCASFVKLYRQPPHFITTRTSSGGTSFPAGEIERQAGAEQCQHFEVNERAVSEAASSAPSSRRPTSLTARVDAGVDSWSGTSARCQSGDLFNIFLVIMIFL